jgi:hypothetical protein
VTTPCTQGDRLERIESTQARIEGKIDAVTERLGHAGDPLTGLPPEGLVAIVLDQRSVNARVSALEAHEADSAARRKVIVANAARIVLPLLIGVGIAKADAIVGIALAAMK